MAPITTLDQIIEEVKQKPSRRLVAAYANDSHTIEAVGHAVEMGIVEGILVGDKNVIADVCESEGINAGMFKIVHEPEEAKAAAKAVELINKGEGDVLMKGLVSTDKYMRAILNKERGLMDPGATLTHVTVMQNPNYHKLMVVGDVAVIPAPDLKQKITIVNYLIKTARALKIETPKVAVIGASETVSEKMPHSVDAAIICKMADRGQIKNALIDGPLAVDLAIDMESVRIKKIKSEVAGDADCMLFPNIEAGNVFYKTNTKLAGAELGAVVAGARVPAVLSSRGDSSQTKMYSIALAALIA